MYYDNKRTFYIKQYGPTALVSVVVIALLTVGSILYFKNSTSNNLIASEPNEQVVDVAKKNETEPVKEKEEQQVIDDGNLLQLTVPGFREQLDQGEGRKGQCDRQEGRDVFVET